MERSVPRLFAPNSSPALARGTIDVATGYASFMTESTTAAPPLSRLSASVDFTADGKQIGQLQIPYSRNESAWGSLLAPIVVVQNGPGKTILLTGGSHGDEYEGPILLRKLAQQLQPEQIQGRVIILPALNFPALLSGQRLSPIDGGNMNRAFPGQRDGTITQAIAHYVQHLLLPLADIVVDLHSGGYSLEFVPSAIVHELGDRQQMDATLAALQAFGAPVGLILEELDADGMLDTAAERAGKIFLSTELAGAGSVSVAALDVGWRGLQNLLAHFGIARESPPPMTPVATRLLAVPDGDCYLIAPASGIFEPFLTLGGEVRAGQALGQLHFFEEFERPSLELCSPQTGVFWCRRAPGRVERGDCVAVVAVPATR